MEQVFMQETHKSPDERLALDTRNHQLLTLVGELLHTNQELRFKVAELERQAESADCALEEASRWSGFLLP
ncbi:MAG TPA: hypothetical protein VMR02_09630 [Terracidiphilus sp.]|jgi:hypothetical protein|nr:hypothetical protein [Terracidiphilus sp.]